jgi:PPOX class probable F420-dependent enzyme
MDATTLAAGKYLLLTTFRRDGTPVATPVWVVGAGSEILVLTGPEAGKTKRLRNNSKVLVAPCDMRGRPTGEAVAASAILQDAAATERTEAAIRRRYGWMARLAFRRAGRGAKPGTPSHVGIAITLDPAA